MMHFTQAKDLRTEKIISDALAGIASDIASSSDAQAIQAVILGGGYGRGEGGATPDGKPYNDLDFFVVLNENISPGLFPEISEKWEHSLNIDVDFFIVSSLNDLYKNADTLMMQELFAGYHVIFGDRAILDNAPKIPFNQLPWREGARLLLNRGTGLLLSREKLEKSSDSEFVKRNIHKALLGCGDALLIASHNYKRTGIERLKEIKKNYGIDSKLATGYEKALSYKYSPEPEKLESVESLREQWKTALEIFFETNIEFSHLLYGKKRQDLPYRAARDLAYAGTENAGNKLKNILLSLRYLAMKPKLLFPLCEHPRVKILALLINVLDTDASPEKYLALWNRFN